MLVVARGLWRPGDYGGQGTVAAGGDFGVPGTLAAGRIMADRGLWRPGGFWRPGVCGGRRIMAAKAQVTLLPLHRVSIAHKALM